MEDDFMKEKWLYIAILLIGIILFGVIEALKYAYTAQIAETPWIPFLEFLSGIGMTLMTATIISWMVDRVARAYNARKVANERKEIRDDVFKSVYSRFFSEKVLSEFDATLFSSEVLKLRTRIEMDLTKKDGTEFNDEWLLVEYKHSYTIKNVTNGQIEHPVKLVLELPLRNALKKMCRITRVEIRGEVLSGAELEKQDLIQVCEDYKTLETARALKSGEEMEVSFSYQTVKKKEDYELIVMLVPTEDISIRARGMNDLVLRADSNNSKKLACRRYGDNDCEWELAHGMLPYQSVTVWWKSSDKVVDA